MTWPRKLSTAQADFVRVSSDTSFELAITYDCHPSLIRLVRCGLRYDPDRSHPGPRGPYLTRYSTRA